MWPHDALKELVPRDFAIFAVCLFSFTTVFSDWWESGTIDVACKNEDGNTLLIPSILGNSLPICKQLLEGRIDLNMSFEEGSFRNALTAAAENERLEIVKCFVETGVAKEDLPYSENSAAFLTGPLAAAIHCANIEIIKCLLQEAKFAPSITWKGIAATYTGKDQALLLTSLHSGTEMLKLVIEAGADVNTIIRDGMMDITKRTALSIKASRGHLEGVRYLVCEAGADVNMPIPDGEHGHALEASASLEVTQFLVEEGGANVNTQSAEGYRGNALVSACRENLEMVKYLMGVGADVNIPPEGGCYGSALAAACTKDIEIVKFLVESGAEINMPLEAGNYGSALVAVGARGFEIAKYLVGAGANLNMTLPTARFGCALTALAASGQKVEVLETLIKAGADVNIQHPAAHCGTPLIAAACFGQMECVKRLIAAGADVNLKLDHSSRFSTALEAASAEFSEEDKEWVSLNCKHWFYDDTVKEWKKNKLEIVKILRGHMSTA